MHTQLTANAAESPLKHKKRRRIIAAAKENFSRYGYKKSNMDEIALAAGVAKGTVYNYFASKEELFLATIGAEGERLRSAALAAMSGCENALEKLEAMFTTVLELIVNDPLLHRVLLKEQEFIALHLGRLISQLENAAIAIVEEVVREGIAAGIIRTSDPHLLAYSFYKLYQSFGYACSLNETEMDLARIKRFVSDLVRRGFLAGSNFNDST